MEQERGERVPCAVIFDLDDTLYPEIEYVESAHRALSRHFPEVKDLYYRLSKAFSEGKNTIKTILTEENLLTEEVIKQWMACYYGHVPEISLYPGVPELLCSLSSKGVKTGIITDGVPVKQRWKLKVTGLDKMVDHFLITDELGGAQFRKPCEKAFCIMREYLDIPFSRMLYVGNDPHRDFEAPRLLGMPFVWFENPEGIHYDRFCPDFPAAHSLSEMTRKVSAWVESME